MLIKFSSQSGESISMFEKEAVAMLRSMDMSGKVPGGLKAEDIPQALEHLQHAIQSEPDSAENDTDGFSTDNGVDAKTRAFPLLEMLNRAVKNNETIMWEYE